MQGVKILSSDEFITESRFNKKVFSISIAFAVIFFEAFAVFLVAKAGTGYSFCIIMFFIGVLSGLLIGGILGAICAKPLKTEIWYRITIDENVSINEFYQRYEVLCQEGAAFIVRERC